MKSFTAYTHRIFYEPHTHGFKVVNNALAALTLISVLALILETVPRWIEYRPFFETVEYITVFFFTLEYLGRIVAKRKNPGAYIFSGLGIIDLLAITPTFIGLTNLTFLKTARILRIMRLLRVIRVAKIARLGHKKGRDLEDYKDIYKLNIAIYFFALMTAVVIFGTLMYIIEGNDPTFASIPLGMLWAIKPLVGGIAQTEPSTIWGEFVAIGARFTGLVLFGLLIAIMGNTISKLLFGSKTIDAK